MTKDYPKYKSVLLFSAGLDSMIAYKLLQPDILLYIDYGGVYQKQEIKNIRQLIKSGHIDRKRLVIKKITNLRLFEREDLIIPLRNLFLINYAALYGETIIMGAMYGDRSLDKSKEFFQKTSDLLTYLYSGQHWCVEREVRVCAPFRLKTKTEIVKEYLDAGYSEELLLKSYSCYEGNEKPCQKCKPCFRKWVALTNNNIHIDNFDVHKLGWLTNELIDNIKNFKYRGEKEDREILQALKIN